MTISRAILANTLPRSRVFIGCLRMQRQGGNAAYPNPPGWSGGKCYWVDGVPAPTLVVRPTLHVDMTLDIAGVRNVASSDPARERIRHRSFAIGCTLIDTKKFRDVHFQSRCGEMLNTGSWYKRAGCIQCISRRTCQVDEAIRQRRSLQADKTLTATPPPRMSSSGRLRRPHQTQFTTNATRTPSSAGRSSSARRWNLSLAPLSSTGRCARSSRASWGCRRSPSSFKTLRYAQMIRYDRRVAFRVPLRTS